jgi:hypothetical protein
MVIKGGLGNASRSINCGTNRSTRNPRALAGIRQTHLLAMQKYEIVTCGVPRLNRWSSPNTVFFRIAKVIIDPLKRMVRTRFFAHIRQEVSEVAPRLVYRYPATTVTLIALMIRIRCSADHAFPSRVFPSASRFPAMPMLPRRISQAATRLGMAVAKLRGGKIGLVPAGTGAYPTNQARELVGSTKHGQLAESLASEINSAGSKRSFIPASTRFRMPAFQLCATDQREASTDTATLPFRRVSASLNNLQVVKCLSRKFHNVPLYLALLLPARPTTVPLKGGVLCPL